MNKIKIMLVVTLALILVPTAFATSVQADDEDQPIRIFLSGSWHPSSGDAYIDLYELRASDGSALCQEGHNAYLATLIPIGQRPSHLTYPPLYPPEYGLYDLYRVHHVSYEIAVCAASEWELFSLVDRWWLQLKLTVPSLRLDDYGSFNDEAEVRELFLSLLHYERNKANPHTVLSFSWTERIIPPAVSNSVETDADTGENS